MTVALGAAPAELHAARVQQATAWVKHQIAAHDSSHDWFHIERVTNAARSLAAAEGLPVSREAAGWGWLHAPDQCLSVVIRNICIRCTEGLPARHGCCGLGLTTRGACAHKPVCGSAQAWRLTAARLVQGWTPRMGPNTPLVHAACAGGGGAAG